MCECVGFQGAKRERERERRESPSIVSLYDAVAVAGVLGMKVDIVGGAVLHVLFTDGRDSRKPARRPTPKCLSHTLTHTDNKKVENPMQEPPRINWNGIRNRTLVGIQAKSLEGNLTGWAARRRLWKVLTFRAFGSVRCDQQSS